MTSLLDLWLCRIGANTGWLIGYWGDCPVVTKLRLITLVALILVAIGWLIQRRAIDKVTALAKPYRAHDQPELVQLIGHFSLRRIRLLQHEALPIPAVCLDARSVMVNPHFMNTLNRQEQLGVWCHELSHIKRKDMQRFWVFHGLVALFPIAAIELFANSFSCEPLAQQILLASLISLMVISCWLLSLYYRIGIELQADRLAAQTTGDPVSLATALIKAQRWLKKSHASSFTCLPTFLGRFGFNWRIKRLINMPTKRQKPAPWSMLAFIGLILLLAWASQTPATSAPNSSCTNATSMSPCTLTRSCS